MFRIDRDPTGQLNGIDNPSLLYTASDELLTSSLLTPDPDNKFDISGSKTDDAPFGDFHTLGIYEQYNESGPSSVQFGDGLESSEHGGSHLSTKDEVSGATLRLTDWHARANGVGHSPLSRSYHVDVPGHLQNSTKIAMGNQGPLIGRHMSPIQQELLDSSPATDQDILDHIVVQTATSPNQSDISKDDDSTRRKSSSSASPKKSSGEFKARASIPQHISWMEFARQGILAAFSSRLNPYALHPGEYKLLRTHITRVQVTVYLNIRNAILRLWHRNPLVGVTRQEAAGCVKESRYFNLSQVAYDWLLRNGYINFGCVELSNTARSIPRPKAKGGRRKTIVVVGAGMSGLGCARQLEGLVAQLGERFTDEGERPPKIIVLEGRNRVGGRVYSHPLRNQQSATLPPGLRCTAEMGAQIVTGFEHGNPMNAIIRGQLGLRYYALKDNSVLYDYNGQVVDRRRDIMIERLWNDILERAAVYRNKLPTVRTVEGDRSLIILGEDPKEINGGNADLISELEDAGLDVTVTDGNPISTNTSAPEHSSVGVDKVGGRQYQLAGSAANRPAGEAAKVLGWELLPNIPEARTLDLHSGTQSSNYPTLGETMDEGIRQYQEMLGLTAQDLRLLNWHHANLEYANAANVNELSLGGWDQDIGNEFEGEHCEIVGGYTQVPRGLWQVPQPLDVRFGHAVKSIRYRARLPDTEALAIIECYNGEKIEADEVVLTSSLGVLKERSINFNPPLPEWKTSCIDRMGFGLLNKVVLVYEKPFWEEDRDMFGLLNESEYDSLNQKSYASQRGRFYLFWNRIKTSGRPMLVALMAGTAAYSVEESDNDSLVREVTGRLAKIFAPAQIPEPSEVIVTRWKRDPFARGSYSYVGAQTLVGDYDIMAKPVGPIHFAGEATCGTHPATVHGAYLSGLRAASEVIETLLGPIQVPSPLVARGPHKIKTEPPTSDSPLPAMPGTKRKRGYVDIWEPILPPPDPNAAANLQSEVEAYEARIIGAILTELGDRPIKPEKTVANPYLLYQNDEWYNVKARCDAQKIAASGDPNAKASRNEIRIALGAMWRNSPDEIKRPYMDKSQSAREVTAGAMAAFTERAKVWDKEASRIRREFIVGNPPGPAVKDRLEGRTAIEFGGGRKGRKMDGYGEEDGRKI